jgi:hypothetical protein
MKPEDEVLADFADRGVRRGKSTYYDAATAAAIVRVCASRGIVVLAVEGLLIEGGSIYPNLAAIFDGSIGGYDGDWENFLHLCNQGALKLVEEFAPIPGYVFDLDLRSKETWENVHPPKR